MVESSSAAALDHCLHDMRKGLDRSSRDNLDERVKAMRRVCPDDSAWCPLSATLPHWTCRQGLGLGSLLQVLGLPPGAAQASTDNTALAMSASSWLWLCPCAGRRGKL